MVSGSSLPELRPQRLEPRRSPVTEIIDKKGLAVGTVEARGGDGEDHIVALFHLAPIAEHIGRQLPLGRLAGLQQPVAPSGPSPRREDFVAKFVCITRNSSAFSRQFERILAQNQPPRRSGVYVQEAANPPAIESLKLSSIMAKNKADDNLSVGIFPSGGPKCARSGPA